LIRRQAGSGKANDDCIVAREHEVDHDDLKQRRQGVGADEISHDGSCGRDSDSSHSG